MEAFPKFEFQEEMSNELSKHSSLFFFCENTDYGITNLVIV